jgi:hypothetical protein
VLTGRSQASWFDQIAVDGSTRLERTRFAKHGFGYGSGFGASQADYAYAAATERGGDRYYSVVEIHAWQRIGAVGSRLGSL